MRPLYALPALRVIERLRSGSSSPVVVETSGGLFVAKLRGAGQGVLALVAEIIVAELAEGLGLPVPERLLIELLPNVQSDDSNDELLDLLNASIGTNLGFRHLAGASDPRAEELERIEDEFAARVLWLDGLTMNPDRAHKNPNILFWMKRPWLIDHGAALPFQYDFAHVTEDSPRERMDYRGHVFEDRKALLCRFDAQLARSISRESLEAAISQVPSALLEAAHSGESSSRSRSKYHAFLWKRLKAPRPFLD